MLFIIIISGKDSYTKNCSKKTMKLFIRSCPYIAGSGSWSSYKRSDFCGTFNQESFKRIKVSTELYVAI